MEAPVAAAVGHETSNATIAIGVGTPGGEISSFLSKCGSCMESRDALGKGWEAKRRAKPGRRLSPSPALDMVFVAPASPVPHLSPLFLSWCCWDVCWWLYHNAFVCWCLSGSSASFSISSSAYSMEGVMLSCLAHFDLAFTVQSCSPAHCGTGGSSERAGPHT